MSNENKIFPFDYLPVLDSCCYCIELRIGCFVVVILNLLFGIAGLATNIARCQNNDVLSLFVALLGVVINIILIIASIYYLIGLIKDNPNPNLLLIILMAIIVFTIVLDICWFFSNTLKHCPGNCPQIYFFSFKTIVDVLLYGYSILIINSYRIEFGQSEE